LRKTIFILLLFTIYFSCSTDEINESEPVSLEPVSPNTNSSTPDPNSNSSSNNSSTPTSFDREAMLIFWADSIIVPAQNKFKNDLLSLSSSISSFSSNKSQVSLDLVREKWFDAYKSWQHIEMFNVGKAEEINYGVRMNVYPVDTDRVESNISNSDSDIENPNDYSAQGFPAIDYLLYGIGSNDSEILDKYTSENSKYLEYLLVVSSKMVELTDTVISDWNSSYRDTFVTSVDNTATSSINKLTNDFIYYYEKGFRANKIGIPAGVFSGSTLLDRVEAYYRRDISKVLAIEAINSVSDFFNGISYNGDSSSEGISFKNYIEFLETTKNDFPLGQLIIDQFESVKISINNLNDDFTIQLQPENKLDMLITYDIIQVAVVLLKVDMLQALNINVDYIDADGD
tara:strand:+ start:1515 stop:2714 length:1200 start_codon:yes stop_codon:yes gene_type:complete